MAKYHAMGVNTVLVCCTGGEAGDILNPAMDRPEVKLRLLQVRQEELAKAAAIIGYDEVVHLGYRDSGMPGSEHNDHPECFAQAPLQEAVGKLVAVIRRTRPQVVLTYPEDQRGYPHPDHLRVHEVSVAAFMAASDPSAFPNAGPAWQPSKLYYSIWSRQRMTAIHDKLIEMGLESPFDAQRIQNAPENEATAFVDVADFEQVRRDALLAHATQIDPLSSFWFGLPLEVARSVHPWDEWRLAISNIGDIQRESDLFAGIGVNQAHTVI